MKKNLRFFNLLLSFILFNQSFAQLKYWSPELCMKMKNVTAVRPSPDGRKVLYTVREAIMNAERSDYVNRIYVCNADGSDSIQLTKSDKNSSNPKWSPDGEWIAYASDRDGKNNLYVLPLGGGESEKITDVKTTMGEFEWSPDGKAIAIILNDSASNIEEKNKKVMGAPIDALYYSMISEIVDRYEQLLTAIELTITNFEQRTLYRPTKKVLEYLDRVSRQIIVLRRHFWHIRDILNFLIHVEKEQSKKEGEVKYIEMAYDNITQLIQLVESYRDTINSTRDLYMANISLQMNDTMRILAIFSAIVLPLTFISGVYGMNGLDLNNINSLPLGFVIIILSMVIVVAILFLFFKKKQWILVKKDNDDDELFINKELSKG